ncbi:MAG: restriction endonuclease [Blastochloris sp.]|nr:restriction endonuclease [Blastochloris sp.]
MIVAGMYSFKNGKEVIENDYSQALAEVLAVIKSVDSETHKTKESKEKTMPGTLLYNPVELNRFIEAQFAQNEWVKLREKCEYSTDYYVDGFQPPTKKMIAFREIDFVKYRVGVEVQFGKYAFMVYNVCAKMTIFHNLGHIDVGIEIVPIKAFADEMSTGVSYFEQIVWDLQQRGVADIDIPVLILGIAKDQP